jgi:hypothetical protein
VRYELEAASQDTWTLRTLLDKAWLAGPARIYPVTVDPSVGRFDVDTDDTYRSREVRRTAAVPEIAEVLAAVYLTAQHWRFGSFVLSAGTSADPNRFGR